MHGFIISFLSNWSEVAQAPSLDTEIECWHAKNVRAWFANVEQKFLNDALSNMHLPVVQKIAQAPKECFMRAILDTES